MNALTLAKPQAISTLQKGLVVCKNGLIKQSPIILAGIAIGGVVTTSVLAARGGIRANELIMEASDAKIQATGEPLTTIEKAKAGFKPMVPAIISGGLTIGAIIASTAISHRRQAALAGLYAMSEAALKELQDKIEERHGSSEAEKIKDAINADHVSKAGIPPWEDAALPQGDVICFDRLTGRYFKSNANTIRAAENAVNAMVYGGDLCASLNDFYAEIGDLPQCSIGETIGWNLDNPCRVYLSSTLTSDGRPVLVLDYANGHEPSVRYRDI